MKCSNCGHKIKQKDRQFCPECGKDVSEQIQKQGKKRKKALIFTGIPVILIAGFVIIFFVYDNMTFSPQNVIDDFSQAVEDEDADRLTKILSTNEDDLTIDKKNASILLDYLSEHEDDKKAVIKNLEEQADDLKQDEDISSDKYAILQLEHDGSKWIFFDDYMLTLTPAYINIRSEYNGIDVYINDEKVATTSEENEFEEQFGPFMPGTYNIKGELDTPYTNLENATDVDLFNLNEETKDHELIMNTGDITISTEFEDATLYVDDEKTDFDIEKGKNEIGPFSREDSYELQLKQEMPWELIESETKTLNEGETSIAFDEQPTISDKEQEKIFEIVNDVLGSYTEALTEKDASLMKDNTTEDFQEDLKERVKEIDEKNPDYNGKLVKTTHYLDWYKKPTYDKEREAYVLEHVLTLIRHETDGDGLGNEADYDKKDHRKYKRHVTLIFDEDNDEWKVDDMETGYQVKSDKVKDYELD